MGICPSADVGSISFADFQFFVRRLTDKVNAEAKTAGMHVSQPMNLRACVRASFYSNRLNFVSIFLSKFSTSL